MFFASDNTAPVHPKVMQALSEANDGYVSSYGSDPIMDHVRQQVREIFEAPEADVFLVATGTTANALSLATFCPPWGAIYCHCDAHVQVAECGAPEFYTGGAKLIPIDGPDAKIDPGKLRAAATRTALNGAIETQCGMVSITNITECGALYTAAEIAELSAIARDFDMFVHLDGARFSNAVAASGATPADMTLRAGVDVLSFGGTKNGLMGVEAVVIFDPAKAREFELRRKRGGHLFSKHRFLSAQMQAYLTDDLWLSMARHANAMGGRLAQGVAGISGASLLHPTDANMVFAQWARSAHKDLKAAGAEYYFEPFDQSLDGPDDELLSARMVCSWSTTDDDVDEFLSLLGG